MTKNKNTQVIQRLEKRIDSLESQNAADQQEMNERGKELVKLANIVRGCESLIERHVKDKLMLVIVGFEKRCELTRRKRATKRS